MYSEVELGCLGLLVYLISDQLLVVDVFFLQCQVVPDPSFKSIFVAINFYLTH